MSRTNTSFLILISLLLIAIGMSLITGPADLSLAEISQLLMAKLGFGASSELKGTILWQIRFPRMIMAVMVGAGLATTGAAIQGLFRNPLADPALIGVSSGAALAAAAFIVIGAGLLGQFAYWDLALPFFAFLGGLASTWLVLKLGSDFSGSSVSTMLLAGIAINAMAIAGVGIFYYLSDDVQLRSVTFWALGSIAGATWSTAGIAALILVVVIMLVFEAKSLNAIVLGDSEARHLGVSVEALKKRVVIYTALGVGIAVSLSGIIAFAGLVVPHLVRLAIGSNHHVVMPASALLGAILLLAADTLSRLVVAPAELPIGIVTALVGGPFFIYLIVRQKKRLGLEQ
jgi:iron complex transport system permease protein